MSDGKTSNNLEPIEEGDGSLAKKFGHVEKGDFGKAKEIKEEKLADQEKEKPREISSAEKDSSYGKILSKIKKKKTSSKKVKRDVAQDAGEVFSKTDAKSQVQHLVDLATTGDVVHAVKVARHLEDNYVLDMFHDRLLSDELHDALLEKGLIGN